TDSIVISFHLAFYAGIVLSFPLLLYFLAGFVLPALTAVEKRFLLPAIGVSFALFLVGVLISYFWLLPKTILFFFRDTEHLGWAPTWTVQQYYSFVTRFTIGFGLAFELPVVVLALVRFGLVTYKFMARTRVCASAGRGSRLIFERLYLPLAGGSLHQPAAVVVLPAVQTTNSMASESAINQLARAWRPVRKLRRKDFISLLRCGTRYSPLFPGDLAKLPVAGGNCVLDFRFVPDRRN